jgi:hypothetical protein
MMNTPLPSNLMFFCRNFLRFPKMDIFNRVWDRPLKLLTGQTYKKIGRALYTYVASVANDKKFAFDYQFDMRSTIPDQFEDLGYSTHNFLVNTSSMMVCLFIVLSLMPLWFILKSVTAFLDRKEKVTLSKDTRERKR